LINGRSLIISTQNKVLNQWLENYLNVNQLMCEAKPRKRKGKMLKGKRKKEA
jgi:hypothetical protein